MKELTLSELQNEELKILKDVHEFCIKNNIRYSLYGGTQIGAIRHKGFIPWDDDIDIIMPRKDYTRFCKEYISDKYEVACVDNNKDYMLGFARVFDSKNTTMVSYIPWLFKDVGVWIDIFPADGMPDNDKEIRRLYDKVIRLRKKLIFARRATISYSMVPSIVGKKKLFVKKVMTFNGRLGHVLAKRLNKIMQTYDFESSSYWASLSNVRGLHEKKHHNKATFQTCELVDFEDMQAYVMNGTDTVLRERYNDYMKLPPENERIPKGSSFIHYYWKE